MNVDFTSGPATERRRPRAATTPPGCARYDVANTDFFEDLNQFIPDADERLRRGRPARRDRAAAQSLSGLRLARAGRRPAARATPGRYGERSAAADRAADADQAVPVRRQRPCRGGLAAPGTYEEYEFTIGPERRQRRDARDGSTGTTRANDFDLFLYQGGRERRPDARSAARPTHRRGRRLEEIDGRRTRRRATTCPRRQLRAPSTRRWRGIDHVRRRRHRRRRRGTGTGAYTPAEKDAWFAKLRAYVRGRRQPGAHRRRAARAARADERSPRDGDRPPDGLRRPDVVRRAADGDDTTTDDPLAKDVDQHGRALQGARLRGARCSSRRRSASRSRTRRGADESHARQYDVDQRRLGGRRRRTCGDLGRLRRRATPPRTSST